MYFDFLFAITAHVSACLQLTHQLKHHRHTLPGCRTNVFSSIHQALVALQHKYTIIIHNAYISQKQASFVCDTTVSWCTVTCMQSIPHEQSRLWLRCKDQLLQWLSQQHSYLRHTNIICD